MSIQDTSPRTDQCMLLATGAGKAGTGDYLSVFHRHRYMEQVNSDGHGPSGPFVSGQRVLVAAKRGHPQAIARLLNAAIPWPDVTSQVRWEAQTLVITLQGEELTACG